MEPRGLCQEVPKANSTGNGTTNNDKTDGNWTETSPSNTSTLQEHVESMVGFLEEFHDFMEQSEEFEYDVLEEVVALEQEIKVKNALLEENQKKTLRDINFLVAGNYN